MKPQACPYCRGTINGTAELGNLGLPPSPGDWGCCVECGGLLRFDLVLVAPDAGEWAAFQQEAPLAASELLRFREQVRRRGPPS